MSKTNITRRRYHTSISIGMYHEGRNYEIDIRPYSEALTMNLSGKSSIQLQREIIETDPDAKIKFTPSGISYYERLPEGAERCKLYTQFYRLVNGAKHWKKDNIELRIGMYFLIYSSHAKKYFLRQVHEDLNVEKLKQYIRDKNLYLLNKDQS